MNTYYTILFTQNSRKFKLIYGDKKHISICLEMGKEGGITKDHMETFGAVGLFIALLW